DRVETEVVLTITPHVVRSLTTPSIANQSFWSGTDQNYATTQLFPSHAPPHARTVAQTTNNTGVAKKTPSSLSKEGTIPGVASVERSSAAQVDSDPPSSPSEAAETEPANPLPLRAVSQTTSAASVLPGKSPSADLVARAPGLLTLRPTDFSAVVGQ